MGLAFDRDARREQLARVARVFRRDSRGDGLRALEATPRVERFALSTGVQVRAAAAASSVEADRFSRDVAAARAPDDLAKARNVRGASFEGLAFGLIEACLDAIRRWLGCSRFGATLRCLPLAP